MVIITYVRRTLVSPYTLMVRAGCGITATSHYNFTLTAPGRLKIPPTHPADGGGPERPPTDTGWDTAVADSGPTRPP
jgi:hypothetical protein